jgi:hypothetical protein
MSFSDPVLRWGSFLWDLTMTNFGKWTDWKLFPYSDKGGCLTAPLGPGAYDLRLASTGEPILCGISRFTAVRMSSLLPRPRGTGTRKNAKKRQFVEQHLADIEHRTIAFATKQEARECEKQLLASQQYRFPA